MAHAIRVNPVPSVYKIQASGFCVPEILVEAVSTVVSYAHRQPNLSGSSLPSQLFAGTDQRCADTSAP